ncbi:MAG: T9SS type A sorting domain-containing protein, partial [Bacteroidota bacterium]|nr:T9SS type A sorting domain-containing protein [Bacteroidota bacterium]
QENISAAQVASQITALNADFAGTNTDIGSIPGVFSGVKAGDTQIQFCLAVTDPSGNPMAEPGIHRQKWNTIAGATDPDAAADAQTLFDDFIKPATIWDPVKYMNIWVAKMGTSGLLGYASWPAASGLTGLGTAETATTSGVVINCYAFGTTGIAGTSGYSMYNKGRTATHEIGHWLGLRHISGDAACSGPDDYCADTPDQAGGFAGGQGGLNWGCPTHPYGVGSCTSNTNGEMFMNYMDYVDDACMYMFTLNQKTRMQTAMTNGTYRKFLGTHGLCSSAPVAPTASFSIPSTGCTGAAVSTTNNSSGSPTPTYLWSSNPSAGVSFSSTTATAPTITFTNTGTYTVSVTATNSQGNQSTNQTITINNCTLTQCDTLWNDMDTATLTVYRVGTNGTGGYLSGNNNYPDTHKGEYYTQSGISGSNVTHAIAFFYKSAAKGTQGTGNVAFQLYNGNNSTGPSGTAVRSDNVSLSTITTNGIPSGALLAYVHQFSTPVALTANEFHLDIELPTAAGDTAVLLSRLFNIGATNTAWEKWNGAWGAVGPAYGQTSMSFALFPVICPPSVGLAASELNTKVSVYPNPTTGILNVAYAFDTKEDVKIEVTNMLGQVVYSESENNTTANAKAINLTGLSKGVYLVSVSTATDKMVRKIVVE